MHINHVTRNACSRATSHSPVSIDIRPWVDNYRQLEAAIVAFRPSSVRLIRHKDTGESRGFAFIDFNSINESRDFVDQFSPPNPPLLIDGSNVSLEFSDDSQSLPSSTRGPRLDWLCNACGAQNFARRDKCFKCGSDKTPDCEVLRPGMGGGPSLPGPDDHTSNHPNATLVVKGVSTKTQDWSVQEVFRQYAPIKDLRLIHDHASMRVHCFVEFHSVEVATHVMNTARNVEVDNTPVRLAYARGSASFMAHIVQASQGGGLAREALQAGMQSMPAYPNSRGPADGPGAAPKLDKYRPKPREWPPSFEEDNGAWIFDPGSQLFYTPNPPFYYNHQSKAYYNTRDQKYYYHQPGETPPFIAATPDQTTAAIPAPAAQAPATSANGANGAGNPAPNAAAVPAVAAQPTTAAVPATAPAATPAAPAAGAAAAEATLAVDPNKPVSFGLKLGGGKGAKGGMSLAGRKQMKDIGKWGDRQKEMDDEEEPQEDLTSVRARQHTVGKYARVADSQSLNAKPTVTHTSGGGLINNPGVPVFDPSSAPPLSSSMGDLTTLGTTYSSIHRLTIDGKPLVKQQKGKWACLVSKRAFDTEELLEKHVHLSQLYRTKFSEALLAGRIALAEP